jgi:uncharacterized RDD family membrane protein YckC
MKTTAMTETPEITVDTSKKENRLAWYKRMGSMGCDLFLIAIVFYILKAVFQIERSLFITVVFLLVAFIYFGYFEIKIGRTPGKFLTKSKFYTTDGKKPTVSRYVWRNVLRCMGPLAMISWNRCSLLDLFSGCRVIEDSKPVVASKEAPPIVEGWR